MTASLNELWERVSADAARFHELGEQLRSMAADGPRRDDLEAEVAGALAVLAVELRVLDEELTEALDREDAEDEQPTAPKRAPKRSPRAA